MHILKKLCSLCLIFVILLSSTVIYGADPTLEEIRQSLTFSSFSSGQPITDVTNNFILPVIKDGAFIVWESDNENSLRITEGSASGLTAEVFRPPFGEGYATVSLIAYITKNDQMAEKKFLLHIKELDIGFTYSNNITNAYNKFETEFLTSQNIYSLTKDLYLPDSSAFGDVRVSYWSENPAVITETGKITRSAQKDQTVNFYVCFTEGYETFKASYQLTVKSYTNEEINQRVQNALQTVMDDLKNAYNLDGLTEGISLPTTYNGVSIRWSSNDPSVITESGVITRGRTDFSATLTATAEFDGFSQSQAIPVTVVAAVAVSAPVRDNSGASSGGFSGGGGISGGGTVTPSPEVLFSDVPSSHWAYTAINALAKKGIIDGIGGKLYAPDNLLTREQAVKIILPAMGIPVDMSVKTSVFEDCIPDTWYVPYVEAARKEDIVSGISDTRFGVGLNITRQELAVMICRALEKKNVSLPETKSPDFNDGDQIAPWAKDAAEALASAGIINGKDGNFAPLDNATRSETAAIVYRVISLLE